MADITLVISGDAKGAGDALKKVAAGAKEAGLKVEEAGAKSKKAGDDTEKSFFKAQVAFHIAAKAIKELSRFIGDGIKQIVDEEKAVNEMRKAFGLAERDGNSLGLKIEALEAAQRDLSKALAEWILKSAMGAGLLDRFTQGAKALAEYLSEEGQQSRAATERQEKLNALAEQRLQLVQELTEAVKEGRDVDGAVFASDASMIREHIQLIDQETAALQRQKAAGSVAVVELAKRRQEAVKASRFVSEEGKRARAQAEADAKEEEEFIRRHLEGVENMKLEIRRNGYEQQEEEAKKQRAKEEKQAKEDEERRIKEMREAAEQYRREQDSFRDAGLALGTAFVSGLESMIRQLGSGEDLDLGPLVVDAIQTAISGALSALAVGFPFLAPFLPLINAGVGAIGTGLKLATRNPNVGRAHNGAWSDDLPRFHQGGEVPALLLPGERVLSHAEIGRMGGPSNVDAMARGRGGGNTYVINTLDARSFQQRMNEDIGSAIVRAARTNKGEFAQAFRRLAGVY